MFFSSDTEYSAKDTKRGKRVFISKKLIKTKSKLEIGDKLSAVYNPREKKLHP